MFRGVGKYPVTVLPLVVIAQRRPERSVHAINHTTLANDDSKLFVVYTVQQRGSGRSMIKPQTAGPIILAPNIH